MIPNCQPLNRIFAEALVTVNPGTQISSTSEYWVSGGDNVLITCQFHKPPGLTPATVTWEAVKSSDASAITTGDNNVDGQNTVS